MLVEICRHHLGQLKILAIFLLSNFMFEQSKEKINLAASPFEKALLCLSACDLSVFLMFILFFLSFVVVVKCGCMGWGSGVL